MPMRDGMHPGRGEEYQKQPGSKARVPNAKSRWRMMGAFCLVVLWRALIWPSRVWKLYLRLMLAVAHGRSARFWDSGPFALAVVMFTFSSFSFSLFYFFYCPCFWPFCFCF
ncbi:hypothetical protein BDV19DRAFT_364540 [Aspergillus venezuelensis]